MSYIKSRLFFRRKQRRHIQLSSYLNLEQKFIFQIGTLNPHGINERFSFN